MDAFISARFILEDAGSRRSLIAYLTVLLRLEDEFGFLIWNILLQVYKDLDPNLRVFVFEPTSYTIKDRFV
jgi:hypothetical protein